MELATGIEPVCVALRKESVDRNLRRVQPHGHKRPVALRKESVDRNTEPWQLAEYFSLSLSARRAWIEITKT